MAVPASDQLRLISKQLKLQGAGALKLEMSRALKAAAQPLIPAVQAAARAQLPRAGGLNEQVAGQKVSVAVRTTGKSAGVRLTTTAPDTAQTDAGFVRHPVFGNRTIWQRQEIPDAAGWWSVTLGNQAPSVTPDLLAVLAEVSAAIQRGF